MAAKTEKRRPAGAAPSTSTPLPTLAPAALRLHRRGRPPGFVLIDPGEPCTIGRGAHVDVCFDDDGVSRVHAWLKCEADAWRLVDARSANGTFVARGAFATSLFTSARPLPPGEAHDLVVGDVIFFGDESAALEVVDAATAATSPTTAPPAPTSTSTSTGRTRRYHDDLDRAARARGPVLLIGPSGSGKTWAARRIHDGSGRRGRFVVVNAAALPEDPAQLRSVLLGHKKGSFTGATVDKEGSFVAAHGGTLFLDEVDSLGAAAQGFFLTLLEQSGDLLPLGADPGTRNPVLDVRIIAASKLPLAQAGLRKDLAFRLIDGAIVEVPSLRERPEDIDGLITALVADLRREDGVAADFSAAATAACAAAPWPGEVRQLRGLVRLLSREATAGGAARVDVNAVIERLAMLERALGDATPAAATVSATPAEPGAKKSRRLEATDVEAALAACDGNIQQAAARLGIARNTLVTKMDAFGIARPNRR